MAAAAEERRRAGRPGLGSPEPQAADGDLPRGGATRRAGPLPLHHLLAAGRLHLQLRGADRQR